MNLLLRIDKLKKLKHNSDKCNTCKYRFSCLTNNEISIEYETLYSNTSKPNYFKVSFLLPTCVRCGLLKTLGDDLHGNPYGKIMGDYLYLITVSVVLKPPKLILTGRY